MSIELYILLLLLLRTEVAAAVSGQRRLLFVADVFNEPTYDDALNSWVSAVLYLSLNGTTIIFTSL